LTKYSADDKKALSEVTKEAKGNYITDDRGNKVRTVPTETAKERFNREGFQAREKFRQDMANEFKEPYGGKTPEGMDTKPSKVTKSAKSVTAPAKPATAGKKAFKSKKTMGQVSKAVADATKPKTMTRAEKSAANKAKWAKMTPAERKNWNSSKSNTGLTPRQESALQRKVGKEDRRMAKLRAADPAKFDARERIATNPKLTSAQKAEGIQKIGRTEKPKPAAASKSNKYLDMQKAKKTTGTKRPTITDLKKNESAYLKETKARLAAAKKTAKPSTAAKVVKEASTVSKVLNSPAGKVAKTAAMLVGPGKFLKAGALVKGAIGANKAVKVGKAVKAAESGKKLSAANTARKAANAAKAEKAAKAGVKGKVKKVGLAAAGFYAIDKIPTGGGSRQVGGSSTPRTVRTGPMSDWSKRSSAKINKTFSTAGGSTTSYTVKKGDTLSGIAKASGVKLSEVLAANPTIADKKSKYKGGSMIWSGTKVKLPTKK
jgi:LysM repeat protein